jgi:FkbM family methyltransferase
VTLSQTARRLVLPVFRRLNLGDITIRHHWTSDPLRLHSFKHKGYWWYGRERERESIELFARLVPIGTPVLDVGSHIGYMAQYFSKLTGSDGHVFCFEPSPENLPYLRVNAAKSAHRNIDIVEAAAGDIDGQAPFFYESITGQNSTVATDFTGFEINSRFNGLPADYQKCIVPMRSIDSFLAERGIRPGFIKIDAEGGELSILRGMTETIRNGPRMMVEVNTHHGEVFDILANGDYALFDPARTRLRSSAPEVFGGNVFAVHTADAEAMAVMEKSKLKTAPPGSRALTALSD